MKYAFRGNTLLTSLLLLSSLIIVIFLAKDKLLLSKRFINNEHETYLNNKFSIIENWGDSENALCQQYQKNRIDQSAYSFYCKKHSFFFQKPTKSYVEYKEIEDYLDIKTYQSEIYQAQNLSDLPLSSLNQPKVVKITDKIDTALTMDFYGIINTDQYFDIKGKYNVYGVIYSSYNNKRKERNLTYKREVIENIEKQLSYWSYLPHSKSTLPNDK